MEPLLGYPVKSSVPKARKLILFLSTALCVGTLFLLQTKVFKPRKAKDFYSFEVRDIRGRTVSLEKYRGKCKKHGYHDGNCTPSLRAPSFRRVRVETHSDGPPRLSPPQASLVVNVASHCEHAERSYRALQELHRELGTSHFNVLAFPCGQFGDTEPGSNRDIEAFVKSNFGVTFPIFSKVKIMGSEPDPAFKYITDSVQKMPKWNFWKFLVNPEGKVVRYWKTEERMEQIRQEAAALVREIILKKRVEL
ncbi:putative glutathione peroxidase 8 [Scleropages formosus]|uniref:Glutathione peroxidase n=1 Tax=Scleropages formosus TaxID=113540 RepID=A0A0P7UDG8_SCLFO|nr:putative glutathione peroxidase 8 [Scleropages formosus]